MVHCLDALFMSVPFFYGVVNRRNDAKHTQNERLLARLFEHGASLGQHPVILCLNANTTLQASVVLSQALASQQWIDLGAYLRKTSLSVLSLLLPLGIRLAMELVQPGLI